MSMGLADPVLMGLEGKPTRKGRSLFLFFGGGYQENRMGTPRRLLSQQKVVLRGFEGTPSALSRRNRQQQQQKRQEQCIRNAV